MNINLLDVSRPIYTSPKRWKYLLYFISIVIVLILNSWLNVGLTEFQKNWVNALEKKDLFKFHHELLFYCIVLLANIVGVAIAVYVQGRFSIILRKYLSESFIARYFKSRNYYKISLLGTVDNPDQRLAEDSRIFINSTLEVIVDVFGAIIQLILFGNLLRSLSPNLLGAAIGVSVISTVFSLKYFGKRLSSRNFLQNKKEADYRSDLIHVRDNSESIAFYRGERFEVQEVFSRLQIVVANSLGLNFLNGKYTLFFRGISMFSNVIPVIIMSDGYLQGNYGIGNILQAVAAFSMVRASFNVLVKAQQQISVSSASMKRLSGLINQFEGGDILPEYSDEISLSHVDLKTPDNHKLLLKDISINLRRGKNVLIKGASGLGKTSIFRLLSGLWKPDAGVVQIPDPSRAYFIPQRPYLPLGTIRQQLLYPEIKPNVTDKQLGDVLERVRLGDLLNRFENLDSPINLSNYLSVGEQQRFAIARALLHSPEFIFLDEATSALDEDNEAIVYKELIRKNITYITISHHERLNRFHSMVIELFDNWTYKIYES
jgi:ABC-type uncharacterized transport system fused permease/ATPase subunit